LGFIPEPPRIDIPDGVIEIRMGGDDEIRVAAFLREGFDKVGIEPVAVDGRYVVNGRQQ
jgi:hypothetical protein